MLLFCSCSTPLSAVKPITAPAPSLSETGKQDSGIIGVSNGLFVVTPDFRADYLSMLDVYKARLTAAADYPADVNDGWTRRETDTVPTIDQWLARPDIIARNALMRYWQRTPPAK
jgi:hypothetical protein